MIRFNGYADEDNFVHGVEYEVSITINKKWSIDKMKNFINKNLPDTEIINIKDLTINLLWPLEIFSGEEEIIMEMYDLLNQGELGTYSYKRIN